MAGAESPTRAVVSLGPGETSTRARSTWRRAALVKALHYNELLRERLSTRLESSAEKPPVRNGTPARANVASPTRSTPRPLQDTAIAPRPLQDTAVTRSNNPWMPRDLADLLDRSVPVPAGDPLWFEVAEDGEDSARSWSYPRLLGQFRSVTDRIKWFVRDAPLAAATTVLVSAAIAGLLIFATVHRSSAPRIPASHAPSVAAIVRPAALAAVPIGSALPSRRRRHRHRRHLRLPAVTVPASLAAPGASPTVP